MVLILPCAQLIAFQQLFQNKNSDMDTVLYLYSHLYLYFLHLMYLRRIEDAYGQRLRALAREH